MIVTCANCGKPLGKDTFMSRMKPDGDFADCCSYNCMKEYEKKVGS